MLPTLKRIHTHRHQSTCDKSPDHTNPCPSYLRVHRCICICVGFRQLLICLALRVISGMLGTKLPGQGTIYLGQVTSFKVSALGTPPSSANYPHACMLTHIRTVVPHGVTHDDYLRHYGIPLLNKQLRHGDWARVGGRQRRQRPLYIGQSMEARAEVTHIDAARPIAKLATQCWSVPEGELLMDGEATVMFPKHLFRHGDGTLGAT